MFEDGKTVTSVKHTDVGIPDDIKSKIFAPLLTIKTKGYGLVLPLQEKN